jgi:hypothetical protein
MRCTGIASELKASRIRWRWRRFVFGLHLFDDVGLDRRSHQFDDSLRETRMQCVGRENVEAGDDDDRQAATGEVT